MSQEQPVDLFPASFAQERLWFLDQLEPGNFIYTIPAALHLRGRLTISALLKSINALLSRHETLRTTLINSGDRPMQRVAASLTITPPSIDLSALVGAEQAAILQHISKQEARSPFDLTCGPLMRVTLVRLEPEEHLLLLTFHHSIADGWSLHIFFTELNLLYEAFQSGKPAPLPELAIQYADYAVWQREWLQGETLEQELGYWKHQLAGSPASLELPFDRPRPPIQTYQGARHFFRLSSALTQALRTLCREKQVTLFMLLLAAFQTLLAHYSGQQDVVVGTPIAGRTLLELEGLIGFFANTLVLRSDLSADPPFSLFLDQVRAMTLEAYDHQEVPFDRVVEALQPERSLSYSPLFQVLFSLQNIAPVSHIQGSAAWQPQDIVANMGTAKFDLSLFFFEEPDGLSGEIEYNIDLFEQATIEHWATHLQTLLEAIVTHPEQRLSALPLLNEAQKQEVLQKWSQITAPTTPLRCLHEAFEAHADLHPDAVALVSAQEEHYTYAQVEQQANRLAHRLRQSGIGPEMCVGLFMERSPSLVISLLAILKAGAAYVPIDPTSPIERVAFILVDAQISMLLTQSELLSPLLASRPSKLANISYLCIDNNQYMIATHGLEDEAIARPNSGVLLDNLAYIIYTSGSTGQPKGVGVAHRQVARLLACTQPLYSFSPLDCWTLFHSIAFDFSVWEIWGALHHGGRSLIVPYWISRSPEEFLTLLEREQVTILNQTPSAFYALQQAIAARTQVDMLTLRLVISGGEALDTGRLRPWILARDDHDPLFVNMYGITETTVHVTQYALEREKVLVSPAASCIGQPLPDLQIYLLDTHMQPVPPGVRGEVYVGGAGLARGYMGHPDLTALRFLPHPFASTPGERLYRTGDVARGLPDGTIEYLGRVDQQVKIRGFRIEPGEIEAALLGHPHLQAAVVLAHEASSHAPSGRHLVAYVVPQARQSVTTHELHSYLQERLPEYMLPAAFVQLERLPMTMNGKLDRQALSVPEAVPSAPSRIFTPPSTPDEQKLADIWCEVLHVQQVDVHTSFFEMGGDSILSLLVIARSRQAGLSLTPRQIFQCQTIAELAKVATTNAADTQRLEEQEPANGLVPLTPIQHWFFEQELLDPHHWNQSVLLEIIDRRINQPILERAIASLLTHHPALSLRFRRGDHGWEQYSVGEQSPEMYTAAAASSIWSVDLSSYATPNQEEDTLPANRIREEATRAQASLHLAEGPLLRAVYLDAGQETYLLLIIHHLVIDAVSWRILREDLQSACQQLISGKPVQLPTRTTAFQAWARHLLTYAQSAEAQRHADYWLSIGQAAPTLPIDLQADRATNTEASVRQVEAHLSVAETNALLYEAARAYHTEINELLLTALVLACAPWIGRRKLLVDMEGHGRETIIEGVDLSRTVGWFTTIFPVYLDLETVPASANPGNSIKAIKEQMRALPQRGIGYGLLRYLSEDNTIRAKLASLPVAEISFNYLGQLDTVQQGERSEETAQARREEEGQNREEVAGSQEKPLLRPAQGNSGPDHSVRGQRRYVLEITSMVVKRQFSMEWRYSSAIHHAETIERVAQRYLETLSSLIAHCQIPGVESYTPSDFSATGLNQARLDKLMTRIRTTKTTL